MQVLDGADLVPYFAKQDSGEKTAQGERAPLTKDKKEHEDWQIEYHEEEEEEERTCCKLKPKPGVKNLNVIGLLFGTFSVTL